MLGGFPVIVFHDVFIQLYSISRASALALRRCTLPPLVCCAGQPVFSSCKTVEVHTLPPPPAPHRRRSRVMQGSSQKSGGRERDATSAEITAWRPPSSAFVGMIGLRAMGQRAKAELKVRVIEIEMRPEIGPVTAEAETTSQLSSAPRQVGVHDDQHIPFTPSPHGGCLNLPAASQPM